VKARKAPLPVPTSDRYWSHGVVTVERAEDDVQSVTSAPIWFRFPVYPEAYALRDLLATYALPADRAGDTYTDAEIGERLPVWAALVGWCWWDLTVEIETPRPSAVAGRPRADDLLDYGVRVLDELQEAGVNALHLSSLAGAAIRAFNERMNSLNQVGQRLDFSKPPRAQPT
jgi:hypothetical protein